MKRILMILVLAGWVMGPVAATAEDKTVTTEGSSSISRAEAVRQAQRAAVEEGVGVFIQSESEMQNFVLKKDKIISRTQGYIKRFDVIKESAEGGEYIVTIRATVSLDKIKDDLMAMKILLDSMERPKIMILVSEDYKSMDHLGMELAGTELSALMGAKGFDLVDKAQVEAARSKDQSRQALSGNDAAARSLGLRFGAQYVIVGKAVTQDAGEAVPDTGLKSIQASLQARVIQTQTGAVLGSVIKNGVSAHISPLTGATTALKQAVKLAVDEYLVNAITNSFQDFLNNGAPIKLHITGVGNYRGSKAVSAAVENMNRVVSSKKEGWNKAGGILVLDLRFKGTSDELAELLDGQQVGSQQMEVVDVAPERVDCQVN
jgi:hypothetical protein